MHLVLAFLLGAAMGGSGIGYLSYNYGKKVVAIAQAVAIAAKP